MRNSKTLVLSATALAAGLLCVQVHAQTTPVKKDEPAKLERVEVTGSLIKRVNKETPSVVQVITAEQIKNSGFATVEDLLRSQGAADTGSITDGAGSGFVSGVSTASLRGLGSQSTLVLINGRRVAPVAAVDINFGRGNLTSLNTIPQGMIERTEVLKSGASATYGSDAMAGVINYILKKEYKGVEGSVNYNVNDKGVGATKRGNILFGFGDLDSQRFNIYGSLDVQTRDRVMYSDLKDRGNLEKYNEYLRTIASAERFTPNSVASRYGSYYAVPANVAGLQGNTTLSGISVPNNSVFGKHYLGTYPGCAAENTVGAGVTLRPPHLLPTDPSFLKGQCRFNLDNADDAISKQDRVAVTLRGNFAVTSNLMAYVDVMASETKTEGVGASSALTTSLVHNGARSVATWAKSDGSLLRQDALILPVGHLDNPTNGTANAQPVQLIYRFEDVQSRQLSTLKSLRTSAGVEGTLGAWDINSALVYSAQDVNMTDTGVLRKSLLDKALKTGSYRFSQPNDAAAIASVASDATVSGRATILHVDARGSRELFPMAGGMAAVAVGAEWRRETLKATPDDVYMSGDYINRVVNRADGSRTSMAAYTELSLPVLKNVETQAALRREKYSDFGNSTTGTLGFKWSAVPSFVAFRGTAATGFRAPSLTQNSDAFAMSYHNWQETRVYDKLRCDTSGAAPVSKANPVVHRDCNVLGFSNAANNPGSIVTLVAGNPELRPEESRSFSLGMIFSPTKYVDLNLDIWAIKRSEEIRTARPVDVMEVVNDNVGTDTGLVLRDTNPQSWLPGVPNSGPILGVLRKYQNTNWTKTAGADYDVSVRFPTSSFGKVSATLSGTYTSRYDFKVLDNSPITRTIGTTAYGIPKTKGSLTLNWSKNDWGAWIRYNHTDDLWASTTSTCLNPSSAAAKPGSTAAQVAAANRAVAGWEMAKAHNACYQEGDQTIDLGARYEANKNTVLRLSVTNVTNAYASLGIPNAFQYSGSNRLGRRINMSIDYKFK